MFNSQDIPLHREQKLKTLLSDQLDKVIKDFEEKLISYPALNHDRIRQALSFALKQKYGQGELNKFYVTHPIRVAMLMLNWMNEKNDFSTEAIEAALIHNVIEKSILSEEEIENEYGKWMANTIIVLTQDREALKDPEEKFKYYERIYGLNQYGQLLKFFDKLDNLYAICLNPHLEIRTQYIDEIQVKVRPIAQRFYPEILAYLDELILQMRKIGHYWPSFK